LEPRVLWTFEPPQRGGVVADLALFDDALFVAAIRDGMRGLGAVYRLDAQTGHVRWTFDDQGQMLQTISAPTLATDLVAQRLFLGEGMHGDFVCKLYSLDLADGKKLQEFTVGGHIESAPVLHESLLIFSAGDEGLHAIDAHTFQPRWNYRASGHVDCSGFVQDQRLYGGSGISVTQRRSEIFCLEMKTGTPLWRVVAPLPVWRSPSVAGGRVYVGAGNGRLSASEPPPGKPAGVVLCLSASNGETLWEFRLNDSVMVSPIVTEQRVMVASRDGFIYSLTHQGEVEWKHQLHSAIVAQPVLVGSTLYVVASEGPLVALETHTGKPLWSFSPNQGTTAVPRMYSRPVVSNGRVYLAGELRRVGGRSAAVVWCLRP
jgi:outer membrane protein assembly factor BamB